MTFQSYFNYAKKCLIQGLTVHCLFDLSAKLQDVQTSLSLMKRDLAVLGETKLPAYIQDSASLQVAKVLRGDYALKLTRQDYFTSNQDQVMLMFFTIFLCFVSF